MGRMMALGGHLTGRIAQCNDVHPTTEIKDMLLAEALAARKDTIKEIDDLRGRLAAAVVRFEDQDAPADDPADVLIHLARALDRFESLTVRINRTNNQTRLTFDNRELSLM